MQNNAHKLFPIAKMHWSDDSVHLCTHTLRFSCPSVSLVCWTHSSSRQRNVDYPHLHGSRIEGGNAKYQYDAQQVGRLLIQIIITSAFIGWAAENPNSLPETNIGAAILSPWLALPAPWKHLPPDFAFWFLRILHNKMVKKTARIVVNAKDPFRTASRTG